MKNRALVCVFVMLTAGAATLRGQAQEDFGVIKVNVHLIEVYATIFDHKGRYVDGLSRDNFEVYEDGKPQRIASFETNSEGLSCAILLDTTGSMNAVLPRVKNSIVRLIDALGPRDSIAVYTFDQQLVVRQEFTGDKDAAKRAVLRTRAQGQTALFDALSQVTQEVSTRHGKKAIIVFTDGDDNASALTASSAVTSAKRLGIPLYSIAEGEATRSPRLKQVLEDLSERTGGNTYQVNKPEDIDRVFQGIAGDLRHLYMLSYQPAAAAADGKWHRIAVDVKGIKDYRVRAKEGYLPN
jgi:Ca-activated chloride channel homolog